jgi:hypothetical protein
VKYWNPHNLKDEYGNPVDYVPNFTNLQLTLQNNLLKKFEELENKISIIIQGPLNKRSINTIPRYLNCGEVVLSYWDQDDKKLLEKVSGKVKLVENKIKDVSPFLFKTRNKNPFAYQYFTTLNGLKSASSNLAIKTRSDESYPDLNPFIKNMKDNMNFKNKDGSYNWFKLTCCNIYFRKDKEFKFHPSDHLIGGNRSRLINTFEKCLHKCKFGQTKYTTPEQLIGTSAIETYFDPLLKKNDIANPTISSSLMKKHFSIFRIKDLPKCTWTSSYRQYHELKGEEDWCHSINEIDS